MRMVRARVSEERLHARGGPCAVGVLAAQQGLLRLLCEVAEDAWGGLGRGSRLGFRLRSGLEGVRVPASSVRVRVMVRIRVRVRVRVRTSL